MKTVEQSYVEYICSNCKNRKLEQCKIKTRYDNVTYCNGYRKDKQLEGYKKLLPITAKIEHCVMPKLASNWKKESR